MKQELKNLAGITIAVVLALFIGIAEAKPKKILGNLHGLLDGKIHPAPPSPPKASPNITSSVIIAPPTNLWLHIPITHNELIYLQIKVEIRTNILKTNWITIYFGQYPYDSTTTNISIPVPMSVTNTTQVRVSMNTTELSAPGPSQASPGRNPTLDLRYPSSPLKH